MSNYTWPVRAIRIANIEDFAQVRSSDRAIVFLTVNWSGPERKSRECFRRMVEMLHDAAIGSVDVFVIEEDDDDLRQQLPARVDCLCAPLGAGTMFWMERGDLLAGEINPGSVGHQSLFERTMALWASSDGERGS